MSICCPGGIGQELADGIMFGNASRFFQTHLT